MFAEVKRKLPISGDDYDDEIIDEIEACVIDLTSSAEIRLPGVVSIKRTLVTNRGVLTESEPEYVITDNSTLKDRFVITVIATWCSMRIGNPPNYDNLLAAYNSMKGQMRLSKTYTAYGEAEV